MKVRNGFVSNSSSSSFIVLLPENLDIEKYIEDNYDKIDVGEILELCELSEDEINADEDLAAKKTVKEIVEKFIEQEYYDDYDFCRQKNMITELFDDYIIASMDAGSSDSGVVELLNKSGVERIKNILKITGNES